MKTYLFVWNPNKWHWASLEQDIDLIEQTGHSTQTWTATSHKKIQIGDRAFLMRLGVEPKGIMGAGFITSEPFFAKHWNGGEKWVHKVKIDFEVLSLI